jgi:hypothetical protein
MWEKLDPRDWDERNDDERKIIEEGVAVLCRTCEKVFRRLRYTKRFCSKCKKGFCEGEHGGFAMNRGVCIQCGPHV